VEEHEPAGDRERVREQRRHARRSERASSLEAELQRDEREPVAAEQGGDEQEPRTAQHRRLRTDVARRVEHAGRDAEACPGRERRRQRSRGEPGRKRGDGRPDRRIDP